jgi:hypothetical protein
MEVGLRSVGTAARDGCAAVCELSRTAKDYAVLPRITEIEPNVVGAAEATLRVVRRTLASAGSAPSGQNAILPAGPALELTVIAGGEGRPNERWQGTNPDRTVGFAYNGSATGGPRGAPQTRRWT